MMVRAAPATVMRGWIAVALVGALAGCSEGGSTFDVAYDTGLEVKPGELVGVVVDQAVMPLPGASVRVETTGDETFTNEKGVFRFQGMTPGHHILRVEAQGFVVASVEARVEPAPATSPVVQVVLTALPTSDPYVSEFTIQMFKGFASYLVGIGLLGESVFGQGVSFEERPLAAGATMVQAELSWDAASMAARKVQWVHATRQVLPDGSSEFVDVAIVAGVSPLLAKGNATSADGRIASNFFNRIDAISYDPTTNPVPDPEGAALIGQSFDAFTTVFYNFWPEADWTFIGDGSYPVPDR